MSSTAGAAEHQGGSLGEFEEAGEHGGRPYYRQKDTEGNKDAFLYSEGGKWLVSNTLGKSTVEQFVSDFLGLSAVSIWSRIGQWLAVKSWGSQINWSIDRLTNNQNTPKPPAHQWYFWDGKKHNDEDTTLSLTFTSLPPCNLVRVVGGGMVVEKQPDSLGDYRS